MEFINVLFSRLVFFIKKIFPRNNFFTRHLMILSLIFICVILLLIVLIKNIYVPGTLINIDIRLTEFFYLHRNEFFVKVFLWITLLGSAKIIIAWLLFSVLFFWVQKKGEFILPFCLVLIGSTFCGMMGKTIFNRQRPLISPVVFENSFSFPSGHSIVAVACYGFLIYYFCKQIATWNNRLKVIFFGSFLILTIGFSRLYLGVHFLSDVLGGYLLGFLWVIIGFLLVEKKLSLSDKKIKLTPSSLKLKISLATILSLALGFYFFVGITYKVISSPVNILNEDKLIETDISSGFEQYVCPTLANPISGQKKCL